MRHNLFPEVRKLVEANIPVLLTGERSSGKTTLAVQVADDLGLQFYSMSMTRQTTLSHLIGFINVNGNYVPSQLFNAATKGGLFLLDEIDAGDANVLLALNTIENGYVSFPEGVVELHPDFRLIATSNPQDQHSMYVGRNKLDAATLDRFDIVQLPIDPNLERSLVSHRVYAEISLMRRVLKDSNSSRHISMRDTIRYQRRTDLGMADNFCERMFGDDLVSLQKFKQDVQYLPKHTNQNECDSVSELFQLLVAESKM